MRLVLATGNRDKARELATIVAGAEVGVAPPDFDPEETGTTLFQNALIKARALRERAEADGAIVLADDSGLSVQALDGRPGVYSARYAGPDATYADNCALLLSELSGTEDRRAAFGCVLVAIAPDDRVLVAVGTCPGTITSEPRGQGGFGYDPVFQPMDDTRTMAEMPKERKAEISHRGRAMRRMAALLDASGLRP